MFILLLICMCSLCAQDIVPPKEWKHAGGNENNFDIWAVGVNQDALWHIDLNTGRATVVGKLGVDIQTAGLSFDNKGVLYMLYSNKDGLFLSTVDRNSGLSTLVKQFPVKTTNSRTPLKFADKTIGFEISQNGKHFYWSNRRYLMELDIKNGKTNEVMKLEDGTWCLAKAPGGKLYGIGLRSKDLMVIDPTNKNVQIVRKLDNKIRMPALALTPGGRMYCDDMMGNAFFIGDDYVGLGVLGDSCHGFAISNK